MEGSRNLSDNEVEHIDYSLIEGDITLLYDEIKYAMNDDEISSDESEKVGSSASKASKEHVKIRLDENDHKLTDSFVKISSNCDDGLKSKRKLEVSSKDVNIFDGNYSLDDDITVLAEETSYSNANFPITKPGCLVKKKLLNPEISVYSSLHLRPGVVASSPSNVPNVSESSKEVCLVSGGPLLDKKKKKLGKLKLCLEETKKKLIQKDAVSVGTFVLNFVTSI